MAVRRSYLLLLLLLLFCGPLWENAAVVLRGVKSHSKKSTGR